MPRLGAVHILAIVGAVTIAVALFYVVQITSRARVESWFRVKRAALSLTLYASGFLIFPRLDCNIWQSMGLSLLLGLMAMFIVRRPRRTRAIPARVKRAVMLRDLKDRPFDPQVHHIDHILPFSKWGDNSESNLRVVPKEYNLRRGARMPGLLDVAGYKPRLPMDELTVSELPSDQDCIDADAAAGGPDGSLSRGLLWPLTKFAFLLAVVGLVWGLVRNAKSIGNATDQGARELASSAPASSTENPGNTPSSPPAVDESPVQTGTPAPPPPPPTTDMEHALSGTAKDSPLTREVPSPSTHQGSPTAAATPPPELTASGLPTTPPEPAVRTFTTTELFALYGRDKSTADYLVKGQLVRVSGAVRKVGTNEVQLKEAGDPDTVKCQAARGGAFVRPRPTLGTVAVVKGRVRGRGVIGNITLDGCEVVEP